jgi:signal peptidase II
MQNTPVQPNRIKRWAVLSTTAVLILFIDQATKMMVEARLAFGETWEPIPAIRDFFSITHSRNTGAAFSLLPPLGFMFLIISVAMIVGIIVYYPRMQGSRWIERIALGLVLGGACGNALDRIRLGYVVDFVHLQLKPLISNVSNLADHAIVVGILILFIAQWRETPNKSLSQPEISKPEN